MRIENSFIPVRGVGARTERNLWKAGVTHWDEFDPRHVGAKTGDRIESYIAEAQTHLDDGNAHFFDESFPSKERWRLYENFREETCFFDIETTGLSPDRDKVTTVSFFQDGETTTLVRDDTLTADALREQFADATLISTFNGARFDVPFLETSFDLSIDLPHIDLMYPCKTLDLSGGLKQIEKDIGIERDRPDISGRDAVRLWHEYERGDDSSLETLVSYNREDTVNLQRLMETVTERLHHRAWGDVPSDS